MKNRFGDVKIEDVSEKIAKLDVQGPLAEEVLQKLINYDLNKLKRLFSAEIELGNVKILISSSTCCNA